MFDNEQEEYPNSYGNLRQLLSKEQEDEECDATKPIVAIQLVTKFFK
ncbi:MAG: hypothetical protein WDN26_09445 [Chitinophagaceae bacterium]